MGQRHFSELSDMGNADDSDVERSLVRPLGPLEVLQSYTRGQKVALPDAPITVQIDGDQPLEDMPWSHIVPVVSERFREFLERRAADNAQFFPVRLEGPGKLLPKSPYYVVNWTNILPAIDMDKSRYHRRPLYEGSMQKFISFDSIVIDDKRVPTGVRVFRLKDFHVTVVTDDEFVNEIKAHGLSGVQFYKLERPL